MIRRNQHNARAGRSRGGFLSFPLVLLSLSLFLLLGAASSAQAVDCSDYPGGVIDGFAGTVASSQLQIDTACTIRNFPATNPLTTNFSFLTQPGQTQERWLVVFDNVVHTGQMACNSVAGHTIWFVNGSSSSIQEGCQNLLIPVEKIDKQTPAGQTTAAIGVPFTYTLTSPVLFDPATGNVINSSGSLNDLHGVRLTDDLNRDATGADLTYLSHVAYWQGSGAPVPHTFTNVGGLLTFEGFPIIPAGEQVVIELTVVLDTSPANTPGTQFINTAKWDFGRLIDGVFYEPLPGEWGISPPLTIAAPELVMTKTGPTTLGLTLNLGAWGQFALDVQNTGLSDAFDVTILDRLPNDATGGMCDTTPEVLTAQVFATDGTTPVSGVLIAGTDYTVSYSGAPTCELTINTISPAAAIGPNERLILTYRTKLDADSQDAATLTNVAGAVQWWNGEAGNDTRQPFTRTLTDGTVGVIDHEDAHTVTVALFGYFFEKSVENFTTGVSPTATAAPGDILRYTLRLQTTDVPLDELIFFDDLGDLNTSLVFVPGSLSLVLATVPPLADISRTDPGGGTDGLGLIDIRDLSVPANSELLIQFDVTVASGVIDGTVALNQADLIRAGTQIADSDDPNINGQADFTVVGDEDKTRVVISRPPVGPLLKENTQATASIGETFSYQITVPETADPFDSYDVKITDDLSASAANMRFLSVAKISGSGLWVPENTGTDTNIVIEDLALGINIPADERIVIEITVVLEDTPTNVAGLAFTNTASFSRNTIDDDDTSVQAGEPGTTAPMTIVEPDLTLTKSGPATMTIGTPETFTLDVHNVGAAPAFQLTIPDQLPDGASGGTCAAPPSAFTAQIFQADGTTPVSAPLFQSADFTVAFTGAPTCEVVVSIVSDAGTIGADQRLIVTYETTLDADTQNGAVLTNVAGATEWFSTAGSDPQTAADRRTYTRTLTDGTVGVLDFQDAHTLVVALPAFLFEKTVINVTTNEVPGTTAQPGDLLRYQLRIQNLGTTPFPDFSVSDELGRMNTLAVFVPGSLNLLQPLPAGADDSNTNITGGLNNAGVVHVAGLSLPNQFDTVVIEFEVLLAAVIADGTVVTNQSQLSTGGFVFADSDDPNVNGPADPFIDGDEDPTRILIQSAPAFQVEKVSSYLTGDPSVLLAGEMLRYVITVKNIGTADAVDTILRDAIPLNTLYVAGSTRLNGAVVADGPGGISPLSNGILIRAPGDPTPGTMRADASPTPSNVSTIVFDVIVDAGVADGTVISNQAFVSALQGGVADQPSDDPRTPLVDDPTRDAVGTTPLLFAPKSVVLVGGAGNPDIIDPGDVLHYTITVYNSGASPATGAELRDSVPANTSYVEDTLTLNGLPVNQPDFGVSPLIAGIPISSADLTPPLPGPGEGILNVGQVAVIEFDLQVNGGVPAGTIISNQAVVSTTELIDVLTDGDGNPSTGPEPTQVVVGDGQQLSITKQVAVVGGGPALPGSELEYVVRVVNIASVEASDVVITDDLSSLVPGLLTYVDGSATMNGSPVGVTEVGNVITANYSAPLGPLDPSAAVELRFRIVIDAGLAMGTTITNTGVVVWNTPQQTANASISFDVGGVPGFGILSGAVWHDADFDDAQGAGEAPLAGWAVELLRAGLPVQSTLTDAAGAYVLSALTPNVGTPDDYALRFAAPGAGTTTAALGRASSPYTNGPQQISNIIVASGSNLQNLDLPIDPSGVVYDAVLRTPLAGSTLTLLNAATVTSVPSSCFDDPVQQGQVTLAGGFYKFDLNFLDPATCPSGGNYLIAVTPPSPDYLAGESLLIPAVSNDLTLALSVPTCPGGPNDAVPATGQFCEAQASELAPPTSVLARSPGTNYHLHLALDDSQVPGSSQIFNNHIPLDPVLVDAVAITKTTPMVNVNVGSLVPYVITLSNDLAFGFPDLSLVDNFPAGFHYVEGSAQIDGVPTEPTITGRELVWTDIGIGSSSRRRVVLLLAIGAGVTNAEYVNRAYVRSSQTNRPLSSEATATVRVVPDPTFDCTDVLGKVFDDVNRNGEQERGERGLQGVRLVTARGLAATTDQHGRFHITCAVVPREGRGSNFVLKLDDRTLPSGFRMSTRKTQVKRATRGKVLRFSYGASVHRVVALDMADAVFEPGTAEMRPQWKPRIHMLLLELEKAPAILRVSYLADVESERLVERRLKAVKKQIKKAWAERDRDSLTIETEVFWRRGAPIRAPAALPVPEQEEAESELPPVSSGPPVSALPAVSAGPPILEETPGEAVERHLSSETPLTQWSQDPELLATQSGDRLEQREVLGEAASTIKLTDVMPAIRFDSGVANIPTSYVEKLRGVLAQMRHLENVRLHLIGHADNQALSGALVDRYGDNTGLSRERAGEVAEFLQTALSLPPEAVSFEWAGDRQPIASNATARGRAENRRVEVEVWYDEMDAKTELEDYVIAEEIKRVKICRVETVCKLRYREGHEHRARVRNLIAPLHFGEDTVGVSAEFIEQIRQALENLRDKQNVTAKFVGFSDDVPLVGRAERVYGTLLALSKAKSRRVALAVQEALDLPTGAIASDGRGASQPLASNETERGRALNRRVEVEFWHDDALQELPDEPQLCPDAASAERVTKVYDPPWGRIAQLEIESGEARVPPGYADVLLRAMADVGDKTNVRLRFVGYTGNERLDRRTALVYGDDIGLSTARARRTKERIEEQLGLSSAQVEHEGRGYIHSNDVVNAGFVQDERSYVAVEVVYDELALLDGYDGVNVTPITRELGATDPFALNLMRITVDGEPIDDPARSSADIQRCTDVVLERADIQFRFNDLDAGVRLSVKAHPTTVSVRAPAEEAEGTSGTVRFKMYTNYSHFIERSEVRIFDLEQSLQAEPLEIVDVSADGIGEWQPRPERFASPVRRVKFVLRAYDAEGRFDETAPQQIWMIHGDGEELKSEELQDHDVLLAGYGESDAVSRNIPLASVGTVRVQGGGIPPEHRVWLAGTQVPVDEQGNFVAEVVLPTGAHTVEVAVLDEAGNGELFLRDLELERSDWFYVGIADLTFSHSLTNGPAGQLEGKKAAYDHDSFADGRLAFFLQGKFGKDWELVASADTREDEITRLFTNFLDKSPDALFRRIDPDYYYPTFGDDSTVEEMAPTSGKLYVKLKKGENEALWGNFKVGYLDNELAQVDRGLYGANLHYQSLATTSAGEQRAVVDGFAAQPGTVSSREEFRGTDGSLYFLRRQDLLIGSERVRIEVRDKDSGFATSVVHLRPNQDYDIDYLQGRVLLSEPLESTVSDGLLVRSQGISGNEAWLVVQYEYSPSFDEIDAMAYGGQAHYWVNDHVKLGATVSQNDDDGGSALYGGAVTVRKGTNSWFKLQGGRSEGQVASSVSSNDGGFSFSGGDLNLRDASAQAYRADVNVAFRDLFKRANGRLSLYAQRTEADYSAPGFTTLTDTDQYGGVLDLPVTKVVQLAAKADRHVQKDGLETTTAEADVRVQITEGWSLSAGARYDERVDESPFIVATQDQGKRMDTVVQVDFDSGERWSTYAFGQGTLWKTLDRDSNMRFGAGGAYLINDRFSIDGEVSHGDTGPAVKLGTSFNESEHTQRYLSYGLENERGLNGLHAQKGTLISGARTRIGDSGSVYVEDRYQHTDSSNGLTKSMGMTLTPADRWTVSGNWELGTLIDRQSHAETERRAGGGSVGYAFEKWRVSSGIEYRYDKTEQPDGSWSNRTTWLFRHNTKFQVTSDARLLAKVNHSVSDSSLGQFYDGGYTEAVFGLAYRPVEHDRLDVLAKYTYFYNVPTTEQVVLKDTPVEFIQKSHIASLDVSYDLTKSFSIGGKYAYRRGEVSLDRENQKFFSNDAHLYILRGDWRFTQNWEGSLEGRMLHLPDLDERRSGALITLYRHLGDHFKIGVGYNFTDFSDDLTDLSYDDHGVFLNLVGTL